MLTGSTGELASGGNTRIWAGRIADSFYVDLSLLAIVNGAIADGKAADLSVWRPENAQNSFAGTSVESIVLEVSHQHPQLRPGARIGVWCATKLATDAGGWRKINRAGHPMMWPIFWPGDTDFSDPANARQLFPDVLPYVVGTPASYGFANRHGRTLADNAPEAMLSLVTNTAVPSGLRPSVAKQLRQSAFPYVMAV